MNTSKKCNIFKRFAYAFVPSKYGTLAYQSGGSTFLFLILFTLLITFINVSHVFYILNSALQDTFHVNSFGQIIDVNVSDFTLENGELDLEEPLNYSVEKICIYIDSDVNEITMSDIDYLVKNSGFDEFILGSKTNMCIYNGQTGEIQITKYSQLTNKKITKQDLVNLVDEWTSAKKIGPFLFGILFVFELIGHAFLALVACVAFWIVNLFLHKNARGGKIFAMSIYVMVPWMVVDMILLWLPFSIPSEITTPLYVIVTFILGCLGLFSVHDVSILENEEKFKYKYDQNPYRISGVMPGDAAALSDDAFGGYAAADVAKPSYHAVNGNTKVRLKGIEVEHSALELINKYVKGNLKDLAVQQLGEVTGLNILDCREIIDEWDRYYY